MADAAGVAAHHAHTSADHTVVAAAGDAVPSKHVDWTVLGNVVTVAVVVAEICYFFGICAALTAAEVVEVWVMVTNFCHDSL